MENIDLEVGADHWDTLIRAKTRKPSPRLGPFSKILIACVAYITALAIVKDSVDLPFSHPVFTIGSLTGGWIIAFISSRWISETSLLNQTRVSAYDILAPRMRRMHISLLTIKSDISAMQNNIDPRFCKKVWNSEAIRIFVNRFDENWEGMEKAYIDLWSAWMTYTLIFEQMEPFRLALQSIYVKNKVEARSEWNNGICVISELMNSQGDATLKKKTLFMLEKIRENVLELCISFDEAGYALQVEALGGLMGSSVLKPNWRDFEKRIWRRAEMFRGKPYRFFDQIQQLLFSIRAFCLVAIQQEDPNRILMMRSLRLMTGKRSRISCCGEEL